MAKAFDKQQWQQERQDKVARAKAALDEGLRALQTSDDWKRMLQACAQLGPASVMRLSFRNNLLVQCQRDGTAHVATFAMWQRLGRQVQRGERALTILQPTFGKKRTEGSDAAGTEDSDEAKLVGFRPIPVFALAQTEGDPLPRVVVPPLEAPEAFDRSVEVLREVAVALPGDVVRAITLRPRQEGDVRGAKGWCNPQSREIVVVTGESGRAEQFAVLCHELAHALLHPVGDHHSRPEREVEAESVAFICCHALDLDTSSIAFPYVASWAGQEDATRMVAESGQRILGAANILLNALLPEHRNLAAETAEQAA